MSPLAGQRPPGSLPSRCMAFHPYEPYSATPTPRSGEAHISMRRFSGPVPSQVRQSFQTFSPWTFYRPPAYRRHYPPLDSFRVRDTPHVRPLSADFTELQTIQVSLSIACRSLRAGVLGRYPLIPPVGSPVQSFEDCPLFALTGLCGNKSHHTQHRNPNQCFQLHLRTRVWKFHPHPLYSRP